MGKVTFAGRQAIHSVVILALSLNSIVPASAYSADHGGNRTSGDFFAPPRRIEQDPTFQLPSHEQMTRANEIRMFYGERKDPGAAAEIIIVARVMSTYSDPKEVRDWKKHPGIYSPDSGSPEQDLRYAQEVREIINEKSGNPISAAGKAMGKSSNPVAKAVGLGVEFTGDVALGAINQWVDDTKVDRQFPKHSGQNSAKYDGSNLDPLIDRKTTWSSEIHLAVAHALKIAENNPKWRAYLTERNLIPAGFFELSPEERGKRFPGSNDQQVINQVLKLGEHSKRRQEAIVKDLRTVGAAVSSIKDSNARIEEKINEASGDESVANTILLSTVRDPALLEELKGKISDQAAKKIADRIAKEAETRKNQEASQAQTRKNQETYEVTMAGISLLQTIFKSNPDAQLALQGAAAVASIMFALSMSNPVTAAISIIVAIDKFLNFALAGPSIHDEILAEVKQMRKDLAEFKSQVAVGVDHLDRKIAEYAERAHAQVQLLESKLNNKLNRLETKLDQANRAAESTANGIERLGKQDLAIAKDEEEKQIRNAAKKIESVLELRRNRSYSPEVINLKAQVYANTFEDNATYLVDTAVNDSHGVRASGPTQNLNSMKEVNRDAARSDYAHRPDETRNQRNLNHSKFYEERDSAPTGANMKIWKMGAEPFARVLGSHDKVHPALAPTVDTAFCAFDLHLSNLRQIIDTSAREITNRRSKLGSEAHGVRDLGPLLFYLYNYEKAAGEAIQFATDELKNETKQKSERLKGYPLKDSILGSDVLFRAEAGPVLGENFESGSIKRCKGYDRRPDGTTMGPQPLPVHPNSHDTFRSLVPKEALIAAQILGGQFDFCYRDATASNEKDGKREYRITFQASLTLPNQGPIRVVEKTVRSIGDSPKEDSKNPDLATAAITHFCDPLQPFENEIKNGKFEDHLLHKVRANNIEYIVREVANLQKEIEHEVNKIVTEDANSNFSDIGLRLEQVEGARNNLIAFLGDSLGDTATDELKGLASLLPNRADMIHLGLEKDGKLAEQVIHGSVRGFLNRLILANKEGKLRTRFKDEETVTLQVIEQYLRLLSKNDCVRDFDELPAPVKEAMVREQLGKPADGYFDEEVSKILKPLLESKISKLRIPKPPSMSNSDRQLHAGKKTQELKFAEETRMVNVALFEAAHRPELSAIEIGSIRSIALNEIRTKKYTEPKIADLAGAFGNFYVSMGHAEQGNMSSGEMGLLAHEYLKAKQRPSKEESRKIRELYQAVRAIDGKTKTPDQSMARVYQWLRADFASLKPPAPGEKATSRSERIDAELVALQKELADIALEQRKWITIKEHWQRMSEMAAAEMKKYQDGVPHLAELSFQAAGRHKHTQIEEDRAIYESHKNLVVELRGKVDARAAEADRLAKQAGQLRDLGELRKLAFAPAHYQAIVKTYTLDDKHQEPIYEAGKSQTPYFHQPRLPVVERRIDISEDKYDSELYLRFSNAVNSVWATYDVVWYIGATSNWNGPRGLSYPERYVPPTPPRLHPSGGR